jgi:hypothetical protein
MIWCPLGSTVPQAGSHVSSPSRGVSCAKGRYAGRPFGAFLCHNAPTAQPPTLHPSVGRRHHISVI